MVGGGVSEGGPQDIDKQKESILLQDALMSFGFSISLCPRRFLLSELLD